MIPINKLLIDKFLSVTNHNPFAVLVQALACKVVGGIVFRCLSLQCLGDARCKLCP